LLHDKDEMWISIIQARVWKPYYDNPALILI